MWGLLVQVAAYVVNQCVVVIQQLRRGVKQLLEFHIRHLVSFGVFGRLIQRFGLEVVASLYTLYHRLQLLGPAHELLHKLRFVRRDFVVVLAGFLQVRFVAKVLFGEIEDRYAEEVRQLEQVADFGLRRAVLVAGDVATVEADARTELFLAKLELLTQVADILV